MDIPGTTTPASRELAKIAVDIGKAAAYLKRICLVLENWPTPEHKGETEEL